MPYRIVVIDPSDIEWAKTQLHDNDMVILTHGDFENTSTALERPAFILDEKTRDRLGIEFVPSIVEQVGTLFKIDEFFVENES